MPKPSILQRVIAIFVGLIAATHGVQAILGSRAGHDPRALVAEHAVVMIVGLIAAYGLWRGERWAPWALAANGVLIAALIVSLGALLQMDSAARGGLWTGAVTIVLMTAAAVWYVRRRVPVRADSPLRAE